MTGAGNICDGHSVSGKALSSQMSHSSVLIWMTAELKCGDVKANVMQIVVYGSIHVGAAGVWWYGAVYRGATGHLVVIEGNLTSRRYIDEVLEPVVVPFLQNHADVTLYQQDNARPHSARLTTDFLGQNNVPVLPWTAFSPDLSPIEHLWDQLGRRVFWRQA